MDTAHPPTLLQLLSNPSLSLTDIARTLHLDTPVLIAQLNDPIRGIPPLLAAERARTQLLAAQHLASTLQTITAATNHVTSLIHSLLPAPLNSEFSNPPSASSPDAGCLVPDALPIASPASGYPHAPRGASSSDPSAKCLVPSALPSSPSALSTQHSVLLLRSTDVLRRCAMLFERIANPRALRERAGSSQTSSSTPPEQHPFSFADKPANRPPRNFAAPMHAAAHPYSPPHYLRLHPDSSYYWCTDTRDWRRWDTDTQGPITASPFSLSYRSDTHYHWDSHSNRWWIHTLFSGTPAEPPLEFPIPGDSDFDPDAPPTPRPHRIHSPSPQPPKPVSFLTETRASSPAVSSSASVFGGTGLQTGGLSESTSHSATEPLCHSATSSTPSAISTQHSEISVSPPSPDAQTCDMTSSPSTPCHLETSTPSSSPSTPCHLDTSTPSSSPSTPLAFADDPLPHNDDFVGAILNDLYLARREQGILTLPWHSRPPTTNSSQKATSSPDTAASPPSSPTTTSPASPDAWCPVPDASLPSRSPPY